MRQAKSLLKQMLCAFIIGCTFFCTPVAGFNGFEFERKCTKYISIPPNTLNKIINYNTVGGPTEGLNAAVKTARTILLSGTNEKALKALCYTNIGLDVVSILFKFYFIAHTLLFDTGLPKSDYGLPEFSEFDQSDGYLCASKAGAETIGSLLRSIPNILDIWRSVNILKNAALITKNNTLHKNRSLHKILLGLNVAEGGSNFISHSAGAAGQVLWPDDENSTDDLKVYAWLGAKGGQGIAHTLSGLFWLIRYIVEGKYLTALKTPPISKEEIAITAVAESINEKEEVDDEDDDSEYDIDMD